MEKKSVFFIGLLISLAVTLSLILVFSLLCQAFNFSETVVKIVNQVIKILAIFIGARFCIRNKGALYGLLFGLIYGILTFLIFGLLSKSLVFDISLLLEVLYTVAVGLFCGIMSVNFKR